jgi:hypothetical protein
MQNHCFYNTLHFAIMLSLIFQYQVRQRMLHTARHPKNSTYSLAPSYTKNWRRLNGCVDIANSTASPGDRRVTRWADVRIAFHPEEVHSLVPLIQNAPAAAFFVCPGGPLGFANLLRTMSTEAIASTCAGIVARSHSQSALRDLDMWSLQVAEAILNARDYPGHPMR